MKEVRCAWCGKALETPNFASVFCCSHCQRQYETWCRSRALVRRQALHRWRDTPAEIAGRRLDPMEAA